MYLLNHHYVYHHHHHHYHYHHYHQYKLPPLLLSLYRLLLLYNTDIYGNAAIHYATDKRRKVIVELLLKFGANINLSDHRGITALHLACSNDDIEV